MPDSKNSSSRHETVSLKNIMVPSESFENTLQVYRIQNTVVFHTTYNMVNSNSPIKIGRQRDCMGLVELVEPGEVSGTGDTRR